MTSNTIPITGGPHADMLVRPDSAQSARNLGLLIADNTLLQEDPNEFAEILAGYIADLDPYGAFEAQCVRNVALATVRQNCFYRLETSVLDDTGPGTSRLRATSIMARLFPSVIEIEGTNPAAIAARLVHPEPIRQNSTDFDTIYKPSPAPAPILRNEANLVASVTSTEFDSKPAFVPPPTPILRNEANPPAGPSTHVDTSRSPVWH